MRNRIVVRESLLGAGIAIPLGIGFGYGWVRGIWWLVIVAGVLWLGAIAYLGIGAWRDGRYLARGGRHHA